MADVDGAPALALADHAADRPLHALAIGGERRRRRADAEPGHRHAVGGRQPIDERVRRFGNRHRAAEPDVRLIDADDDQAAAGRAVVRAVAFRRRRRGRGRFRRAQRNPLGRDDAPRAAVDADDEVGGREVGDRLPVVVHDGDVDRGDFDRGLEARFRRLRLLLRRDGQATAEHAERAENYFCFSQRLTT